LVGAQRGQQLLGQSEAVDAAAEVGLALGRGELTVVESEHAQGGLQGVEGVAGLVPEDAEDVLRLVYGAWRRSSSTRRSVVTSADG
jgi:hypothetical protein